MQHPELQSAMQDLWDVIKKMASKIETFNKKRNDLQSQIDFMDNTINAKNNKIKELEVQIANLQNTINEKNERITNQYSEIDTLLIKQEKSSSWEYLYFNIVNENDMLKKDLAESSNNSLKLDKLEKNYNELKTQTEALKKENVELNKKALTLDNVLKNSEIATNEIKNIRWEIINRNDQINKLRITLSEQESVIISKNNKLKQLTTDKANLNNEVIALREESVKFNAQLKKSEDDFAQKEMTLESDKLSYLAIIEHLKNEILDYDKQKQVFDRTLFEKNNNSLQLLKLTSDNDMLRKELESLEDKTKSLYDELDELNQKMLLYDNDFTEDTEVSGNALDEIFAETERLTNVISELTEELEKNKIDFNHISVENEQLTIQIVELQNEINKANKLYKAVEKIKRTNKEQEQTILELTDELISYKRRMYDEDSLFSDMHKLEFAEEKEKQQQMLNELIQKNAELNNTNNELLKRINELEHKKLEPVKLKEKKVEIKTESKNEEKEEIVNKISSFLEKLEKRL